MGRMRLCFCTAMALWLVTLASTGHADQLAPRAAPLAAIRLWPGLRVVMPPLHLDDDLPDVELVLHPDLLDDSDVPVHARAPERVQRWYGRTLLLADSASMAVLLMGVGNQNGNVTGVGLVGMALSGPVVHALHGHWERGGVGLLVRVGGTLLGGFVGRALGGDTTGIAGSITGYMGAMAFDGLYLCRDWVPSEEASGPELAPEVSLAGAGATLGLHGRF